MKKAKCFAEEAARFGAYTTLDAGPRVIELRRVAGTVNKCGQLDSEFRLLHRRRDRKERYRRQRLNQADLHLTSLPPIDVYLLAGEYYVIDGNRRVAAAKLHRLEYMDAHVIECLPLADREALAGAVFRRRFEQETRLRSLRLSYEKGYAVLLREVNNFIPEGGGKRAAPGAGPKLVLQVLPARLRADPAVPTTLRLPPGQRGRPIRDGRRILPGPDGRVSEQDLLRIPPVRIPFRPKAQETASVPTAAHAPIVSASEGPPSQRSVAMQDRLEAINAKLKRCKVYYSRYNPRCEMMYEIEEAEEDVRWMIYEIERLREELKREAR